MAGFVISVGDVQDVQPCGQRGENRQPNKGQRNQNALVGPPVFFDADDHLLVLLLALLRTNQRVDLHFIAFENATGTNDGLHRDSAGFNPPAAEHDRIVQLCRRVHRCAFFGD